MNLLMLDFCLPGRRSQPVIELLFTSASVSSETCYFCKAGRPLRKTTDSFDRIFFYKLMLIVVKTNIIHSLRLAKTDIRLTGR